MNEIEQILNDDAVRKLCIAAMQEETRLDDALEAIFRKGFSDFPYIEGVERRFVERLHQILQEVPRQEARFREDPEAWGREQLDLAEDPDGLVCSLCALTAWLHGNWNQQEEALTLLERRMALAPGDPEENRQLLQAFVRSSSQALFVGGEVPRFPSRMRSQVTAILAMCSYVWIKREPQEQIYPDLSFDAVCIWSSAAARVLCSGPEERPEPEAAATVASVLAARNMHAREWPVLLGCVLSLTALAYPVLTLLMKLLKKILTQELALSQEETAQQQVELENPEESFAPCLALLRTQVSGTGHRKKTLRRKMQKEAPRLKQTERERSDDDRYEDE